MKAEMPTPCSEEGRQKEEPRVDQGWFLNDNNKSEPRDYFRVVLARWLTLRNWNKCIIIWKDNCCRTEQRKEGSYVCMFMQQTYTFLYAFCKMRSNCQHSLDHRESKGVPEEKSASAFWSTWKPFMCDHNTLWRILKEMGVPNHLTCLPRNLHAGQEETDLDMEQWTGSTWGKEDIKTVHCHSAFLTYMYSIMGNAGLEPRLLGEMSITSDMQMTPL